MRRTTLLLLPVLFALALAPSALAAERTRCFAETGFCVSGHILDYWEREGGLATFGLPISALIPNEIVEQNWVGPTQWFERARLEDHGAQGIMSGRLNVRLLELNGRSWWDNPRLGPQPNCTFFVETGHNLCEPFHSYWTRNGGLARFGYPVSDAAKEQTSEWRGTLQHFERQRMEHHTELRGTPYEILLGRIGAEVVGLEPPLLCTTSVNPALQSLQAALPFRERIGCPTTTVHDAPAAVQRMERGVMLWLDLGETGRRIFYSYTVPDPNNPTVYGQAEDTWREGVDPEDYPIGAPAGLYPPRRGFGKVWWQTFRRGPNFIGLGLEPERAERATAQRFTSGSLLVRLQSGETFAFGPSYRDVYVGSGR